VENPRFRDALWVAFLDTRGLFGLLILVFVLVFASNEYAKASYRKTVIQNCEIMRSDVMNFANTHGFFPAGQSYFLTQSVYNPMTKGLEPTNSSKPYSNSYVASADLRSCTIVGFGASGDTIKVIRLIRFRSRIWIH
jgi:hypothetical protein